MARGESSNTLRTELEQAIRRGRCAYCRCPASDSAPLTREHVIPRAKGGRRKDIRIIVPACARCNQLRGCRELVLFLLLRPRRISAFLDHLATLSPEGLRELDPRVLAEVYAAIWILAESASHGEQWRAHLRRLCTGRTLHRRRYAARRLVGSLARRSPATPRPDVYGSASPPAGPPTRTAEYHDSIECLTARLLTLLALAWQIPPQEVDRRVALHRGGADQDPSLHSENVVQLDGWRRRQYRRSRVDRRRGAPSTRRTGGRAA